MAEAARQSATRAHPACVRLRRQFDQGPEGPRCRAQAPRHVYRRHRRRLRPAPHGVRGRRQCDRRGAGRPCARGARHAQSRRVVHGARRRPRHSDRHSQGRGRVGRRGHHDPAPRWRKIRPELLQGVRRSARRRHLGRQRAVEAGSSSRSGATARSISWSSTTASRSRRSPWSARPRTGAAPK